MANEKKQKSSKGEKSQFGQRVAKAVKNEQEMWRPSNITNQAMQDLQKFKENGSTNYSGIRGSKKQLNALGIVVVIMLVLFILLLILGLF